MKAEGTVGAPPCFWRIAFIQVKNEDSCSFSWQVNVKAFMDNFERDLLLVPGKEKWKPFQGKTLFIGGEKSGYIPRDAHQQARIRQI
jgi:hypothetical protein